MLSLPIMLCYHRIIPKWRRRGERTWLGFLDIPKSRLAAHLDALLVSGFTFPTSAVLATRECFQPNEIFVSFDDAYSLTIKRAIAICATRKITPILFVTGANLSGQIFWWDHVEELYRQGRCSRLQANQIAVQFRRNPIIISLGGPCNPEFILGSVAELAAAKPYVSFGWHGMQHLDLTVPISQRELLREITPPTPLAQSLAILPCFAYPYGCSKKAPESVVQAVEKTFRWGFTLLEPPNSDSRRGTAPRLYVSPSIRPAQLVDRVKSHADQLPLI